MNTPASNPFQTATLIRVNNPFDVADQKRELLPLSDRVRLGDLITAEEHHSVSVNGVLFDDSDWREYRVIDGDYVVICPVPGGGGSGKNILRVVALIAIAVAAPWAAGAMGFVQTVAGVTSLTTLGYGISAGIMVGGSMLVNSLIPIEESLPQSQSLEGNSSSYGIDGPKNSAAEGIPVPVVYGTFRVGGNIVNIHTENVTSDDTQDLNILFALSEGPVAAIDISTIEINDQPWQNFADVARPQPRNGTSNQSPIPWFDDNTTPYSVGVTLSPTWHVYDTVSTVDKIRVDIVAVNGFREINDSGESLPISRLVEVEYRLLGSTGAWAVAKTGEATVTGSQLMAYLDDNTVIPVADLSSNYSVQGGTVYLTEYYDGSDSSYRSHAGEYTASLPPGYSASHGGNGWKPYNTNSHGGTTQYTRTVAVGYTQVDETKDFTTRLFGKKTSPYRKSFAWNVKPGMYQIRARRPTEESTDGQIIDKLVWSDINEITTSDVGYKHTALLGMQIRLTDQLTSQPKVTVEVHGRKVRVPRDWYQVGNPWVLRHSSNPAWIALDMLTNTRYGAGYGDHRIDFYAWMRWADYCDQQGFEFNGIFDVSASFWDQLSHVMRCGRAKLVPQGIKYSVAAEQTDFPTMLFNVSNMKKSSLTINWLSMSDRANEIEATYYDATNGYKASILKVVNPTLQQGAAPRSVALNLIGVTNAEQARREAQLLLNMNRFIQQTISFEAPIEALACKVGSMVLVQHDIPQWGFGGRTETGSSNTVVKLDRPVTMEAGKSYSLLLNYDNLLVASGFIEAKINSRNFYISSDYVREGVHSLFVGGNEYNVISIANAGDNIRKILTLDADTPIIAGDVFTLYRLDALEERTVITVAGDSTEVTCAQALPQAPGRYIKWLFGELENSKKPFRVLSIEGEGVNTRTLTCIEYYDAIYNTDDAIGEPPNYSAIPVGEQVTGLTAVQLRKNIGTVTHPVIRLEWIKTTQYNGADILFRRNNDNWQLAGQARSVETSFEFTDLILGETLSFMVIAIDTVGNKAARAGAPIVSITVTSAGDVLPPPTNIRCVSNDTGIRLHFDNPEFAIFLETEIVHGTVNNVNLATRVFRGASEVFVHDTPNIGDNFYWLRSINTDKVPGVYSEAISPAALTQVTNLRLKSAFIGKAAEIIWDSLPGAAAYQVEVRTKSVLRRSERVTVNEYRYGIEDAIADGDVDRNIVFVVWAIGADGETSTSQTLAVTNPPPGLPTNLTVLAGFKTITINFNPPTDPDYVDTVIWLSTVSLFTPSDANRVASLPGGPITITNVADGVNYFIRMSSRDTWGTGNVSAEYSVLTMSASELDGFSPWAFVTQADRDFIALHMEDDAIESTKIASLTASRITTGTLAATENISVEGQIQSVAGSMTVTQGPKLIGTKVALLSAMNGSTTLFRINEDGTSEFSGQVSITGGVGYVNLADKPTSLRDISPTEADALDAAGTGGLTTFYQTTAPLSSESMEADLWFDTDDNNKLYRFNGTSWIATDDSRIALALDAASDADAKADGKVNTYFQTTTPTADAVGDLWYNSSNKTLKRWSGSSWSQVGLNPNSLSDINLTEANQLATAAANASQALSDAASAQSTADGKIRTFYQSSTPSSSQSKLGDLWFHTGSNKKLYRYNGSSWLASDDTRIASVIDAAQTAQTTADGKAETFFSTTTPSGASIGDLWYNSSTKTLKRWSGSVWSPVGLNPNSLSDINTFEANQLSTAAANASQALSDAAYAQSTADGKITTFYQTSPPYSWESDLGDLWFDTNNNNKLYRYSGSSWLASDDNRIADAVNAAQTAQTTADGKAETFFSTSTPYGASIGDLWYDSSTGVLKRRDAVAWQPTVDTTQKALEAGTYMGQGWIHLGGTHARLRVGVDAWGGKGIQLENNNGNPRFYVGNGGGGTSSNFIRFGGENLTINTPNFLLNWNGQVRLGPQGGNRVEFTGTDLIIVVDAIGAGASIGANSVAFGNSAAATGSASVAIGRNSSATGINSVAIGRYAGVTSYGVAIGYGANTSGNNASAIGYYANAYGGLGVAIGYYAKSGVSGSSRANDVAIGPNANATGAASTAVGRNATASSLNSAAFGAYADVRTNSTGGLALGYNATVTNYYSTAIGYGSSEGFNNTIKLGRSVDNVVVQGTLNATTKYFRVTDPTDPEKWVFHSCYEGPNAGGTIYRYTVTTVNNTAEIALPHYFDALNKDVMVMCQADKHFGRAYGEVIGNTATITSETDGDYHIVIYGTRKDQAAVDSWHGDSVTKLDSEIDDAYREHEVTKGPALTPQKVSAGVKKSQPVAAESDAHLEKIRNDVKTMTRAEKLAVVAENLPNPHKGKYEKTKI